MPRPLKTGLLNKSGTLHGTVATSTQNHFCLVANHPRTAGILEAPNLNCSTRCVHDWWPATALVQALSGSPHGLRTRLVPICVCIYMTSLQTIPATPPPPRVFYPKKLAQEVHNMLVGDWGSGGHAFLAWWKGASQSRDLIFGKRQPCGLASTPTSGTAS